MNAQFWHLINIEANMLQQEFKYKLRSVLLKLVIRWSVTG